MVKTYSMEESPTFDKEPKAVLKQVVERYKDTDMNEVYIEAARLPEILSSIVPSSWDMDELQTLIDAVDEDQTGKLDLSKTSQILIYFLKKQADKKKSNEFTKVALKIRTQTCISSDVAMILVYFYPQILKSIDDGHCILQ